MPNAFLRRLALAGLLLAAAPALAQPLGGANKGAPAAGAPVQAPALPPGGSTQAGPAPCPDDATALAGTPLTCLCAADRLATPASVWGTDVYTSDSAICHAARHAGAMPAEGGPVTLVPAPGRAGYRGTLRNGIRTADYGAWDASFTFEGVVAAAGPEPCPDDGETLPDGGAPLTCTCSAEAVADTGSVWGTDVYTSDSGLCRAALHAGAVGAEGGPVTVQAAPGRQSYAGSQRNGVETSDYGPWRASFRFAAPPSGRAAACPAQFSGNAPLTCTCSAEAATSGSVWGSFVYTADSRICRAALHAGAIPPQGGIVTLRPEPGRSSYAGSTRNGVTSANYGAWGASFAFEGVAPAAAGPATCPPTLQGYGGGAAPLACLCPAEATGSGMVWGSGPYTADSVICRAARHAGAVGPQGGPVVVLPRPGQDRYAGSERNGVATRDYGPWGASFAFEAAPRAEPGSTAAPAGGNTQGTVTR